MEITYLLLLTIIVLIFLQNIFMYAYISKKDKHNKKIRKIKKFKNKIRKQYGVNTHFVKTTKELGSKYYVYESDDGMPFSVSETGFISNIQL